MKEYWIVNLKTQSVEVYSLTDKEYSFVGEYRPEENVKSPLLEGLSIPVRTLFPKVSQFTEKIKINEDVQYNGEVSPEAIGETVAA